MKSLATIREGGAANWAFRIVATVIVFGLVLYVPTKTGAGTIQTVIEALVLMGAAMSLNLLLGYTGQISIGTISGFMSVPFGGGRGRSGPP